MKKRSKKKANEKRRKIINCMYVEIFYFCSFCSHFVCVRDLRERERDEEIDLLAK